MSDLVWEQFPPHVLREYALIADGERGALCGPRGDIAWLCAPGWDSDAVFSALIGGRGVYAITPVEPSVWGGYYEPGTLIWRNRWVTTETIVECREALSYPGDPGRVILLRRIQAGPDDIRMRVTLHLCAGFGTSGMTRVRRADDGVITARTGPLYARVTGLPECRLDDAGWLTVEFTVPAGDRHDLVLELGEHPLPDERIDPDGAWRGTENSWQSAVPELADSVAPRDARHAYAVMRGLTSSGGGMVAAATLGIPERAEAGRNYDYRYVWLRDQAYAGIAAAVHEPLPLLDDAVSFAAAQILEHGDQLTPAYRVNGRPLPDEVTLKLPGYPGGRDVVGNHVNGQFQLDAMGEMLTLFATAARHDRLDPDGVHAVQVAVDVIEKRWNEPEAGIWELDQEWWSQSRLACVAGLRTMARELPTADAARLSGLADAMLAETSKRCLDENGAWRRSPNHSGTDASLLFPPVRGALPASDPRTIATLAAVQRDLVEDGYVYRFSAGNEPLGDAEGAFLLCGFGMALAEWHQGNLADAYRWFERNRAACGPPGLLAEEYDVRQRQLRGNLPQAFVHAALLETAQRMASSPD
jgi:hypothetical protein